MSKLRVTERWINKCLWLVAFVFAGFLIGLGGTLIDDLPKVEQIRTVQSFVDPASAKPIEAAIKQAEQAAADAGAALEQARLKQSAASADLAAERQTFNNWLATRHATQLADQDTELIARTRALDALQQRDRAAGAAVEAQQQAALDASQRMASERSKLNQLEYNAQKQFANETRRIELRVFLYRLLMTLPLLVIGGWLFVKKRKSTYWPFVWGFIFFALFAFFVELVPYLPSYGGYVRYVVGIFVTILVGRQAIIALNNYLERQKLVEQLPDVQRRDELSYDTALTRLTKGICPGCERGVDLTNPGLVFCPHCGIGIFENCQKCSTRKSAFSKFCFSCGTATDRSRLHTPGDPAVSAAFTAPDSSPVNPASA